MSSVAALDRNRSATNPAHEARLACRRGELTGHTAGIAPGYVQGNLCIVEKEYATDFAAFCQRNPKPCPVIGMSAVGDPSLPDLGDIDIRTDVPAYHVFRDGDLSAQPTDITDLWRDDLVTFALGCSFSFEEALLAAARRRGCRTVDGVAMFVGQGVQQFQLWNGTAAPAAQSAFTRSIASAITALAVARAMLINTPQPKYHQMAMMAGTNASSTSAMTRVTFWAWPKWGEV